MAFSANFLKNFAPKICGTLKMFLLSGKTNFYIIKFICKRLWVTWNLNLMSSVVFQASKTYIFFGNLTAELVWKSFSGRNNSLQSPTVFWFSSYLIVVYMVWKNQSRELRTLIRWVLGSQTFKNAKKSACNVFFVLSRHYGFMNCFQIKNFVFSHIIPSGVSTCKKLTF